MSKSKHEEKKHEKLPEKVFENEPKEEKHFEQEERYVFEKEGEPEVNPLVITQTAPKGSGVDGHETWPFIFRKRITVTPVGALANDLLIVWQPKPGRLFKITQAYFRQGSIVGTTPTTAVTLKLQNGDGTAANNPSPVDIVTAFTASLDLTVANQIKVLTVTAGNDYIDNAHPLTLKINTAQVGTGVHTFQIILVAVKLST